MTVQSTAARVSYTIAGAGPYTIPYYFLADADIIAIRTPVDGSDPVTLTLATHYTLTGAEDEDGGALTLVGAAIVNGDTLTIINEPDILQLTQYPETGKFPAASHERALDKLTMIAKRVYDLANRALRLNDGDSSSSLELPISSPGKLLGWGVDGKLTNTTAAGVGPDSIGTAELAPAVEVDLTAGAAAKISVDAHLIDATDAHAATAISYAGSAGLSATNVEAALDELDSEKQTAAQVAAAIAAAPNSSFLQRTVLASGTSHTYHADTTHVVVEAVGGGGGGGNGAGAGGGYFNTGMIAKSGASMAYAIGAGGSAGGAGYGGVGGNTTATVNGVTYTAYGAPNPLVPGTWDATVGSGCSGQAGAGGYTDGVSYFGGISAFSGTIVNDAGVKGGGGGYNGTNYGWAGGNGLVVITEYKSI